MIDHAEAMGLSVEYDNLGPRHGEIRAGGKVYLNRADPETLQRVTLAHECGHHWHQHRRAETALELGRQERAADTYAAELLISRADYERAERLYGHNPWALARELRRKVAHLVPHLPLDRPGRRGRLQGRRCRVCAVQARGESSGRRAARRSLRWQAGRDLLCVGADAPLVRGHRWRH